MSTAHPEVSNQDLLDINRRALDLVDLAKPAGVPPRIRVLTKVSLGDAAEQQIIREANKAWLDGTEPTLRRVDFRFVVNPSAPKAPVIDVDTEADALQDAAAAAAMSEDDVVRLEQRLKVLPRVAVTYLDVTASAVAEPGGIPVGENDYFSFPAGHLPKSPGLLIRYDEGSNQLQMRMGDTTNWAATLADDLPVGAAYTPAGADGTVTFTYLGFELDGVEDWELGYRLFGDAAHLPAAAELALLVRRAGARMLLAPETLEIAEGIAARGTTLPVLDEATGTVRNLPTWCVYAYGSRPVGARQIESFYKFYFCYNADDATRLTARLLEASRLAGAFGDEAVLPTTHRYLASLSGGRTEVMETVAGKIVPADKRVSLGHDRGLSAMHVVVAECDRIVPFGEDLPVFQLDQLLPVGKGLDAAHAKGVVFGDVKPDNLTISQLVANGPRVARLYDIDAVSPTSSPLNVRRGTPGYTLPVLRDGALPSTDQAIKAPQALVVNDQAAFFATVCDLVLGRGAGPAALVPDGAELTRAVVALKSTEARQLVLRTHNGFADLTTLKAAARLGPTPLGMCESWLRELMSAATGSPDTSDRRAVPRLSGDLGRLQRFLDARNYYQADFHEFCLRLIRSGFWSQFVLFWVLGLAVLVVLFKVVLT